MIGDYLNTVTDQQFMNAFQINATQAANLEEPINSCRRQRKPLPFARRRASEMASYYVYSGAAGAGTGANWANAYTTLTAAVEWQVGG